MHTDDAGKLTVVSKARGRKQALRDLILNKFTVKNIVIHIIDPVIGAHSGPGTMALFFLGKNRD